MRSVRLRRGGLVTAAAVLALAATWFAWRGHIRVDGPEMRDEVARGDPGLLEAASSKADTRPQLIGAAPSAAHAEDGERSLVEVSVTVVAEGDADTRGESIVEAGEDDGSLRPCGVVSLGETRVLTVRASVRIWCATTFGRPSRFYEAGTARHAPHFGPLTLRLQRGPVSLHARVLDAEDAPVAGLRVQLVGSVRPECPLDGTTDRDGSVHWVGLTKATSDDPGSVRTHPSEVRVDPEQTSDMSWNADRSECTVTLHVERRRLLAGRLLGPGVGVFRSVHFEGAVRARNRETWRPRVSETGEFSLLIPRELETVDVILEQQFSEAEDAPERAVFVVPRSFSLSASEPIEVRTVFGARVEGEVRDASGKPVPYAFVFAMARPAHRTAWDSSHPGSFHESVGPFASTDEQGRFQTATALPGLWVFRVQPKGESWIELPDAIEVPGPGPTRVVLTLP